MFCIALGIALGIARVMARAAGRLWLAGLEERR